MAATSSRLPLLAGQAAIWAAEQLGTLGRPYNARWSISYSRGDATDSDVLAAVHALIELHPSLQTRVGSERGIPHQLMDRPAPVELIHCDKTDPDGTATRQRLADQLGSKVQNLDQDSLSEIYVISAAERVHALFLQHHLGFDGGTRVVLPTDLDDLIGGRVPASPDDFADSVRAGYDLQRQAMGDVSQALELFTDMALAAAQLPEHGGVDGHGQVHTSFGIAGAGLDSAARMSGTTPAGIALVGALAGLVPYSPADHGVLGMVVSTRPRPDSRVAGCFVNTVPVIVSSELTPDRDGAKRAQGAIREATRLRHLPIGELVSGARKQRVALPKPDSVLVSTSGAPAIANMVADRFHGGSPRLTFRLWDLGGEARATLDYPLSVFTEREADAVFEEYQRTVARLTEL